MTPVNLTLAAVAALAAAGAAQKRGSRSVRREYRFSGLTCPSATADLVDWSTEGWFYPSTSEEIDWEEFRDATNPTPEDVTASGYLGWSEDWMPFRDWTHGDMEPGGGTHAWYKGELPSGQPFYVWVGSGIEHWWTVNGEPVNVYAEQEILDQLTEELEALEQTEDVTLQTVIGRLSRFR